MSSFSAIQLLVIVASAVALRDVPLGECYSCEVTCFEDCALKYSREIIDPDNAFVQIDSAPEKNKTVQLTEQYASCLKEDACPCPAAKDGSTATGKGKALELVSASKKKKGKCAVGTMSCSTKCGTKVINQDVASLTKSDESKKSLLQKKDFPLHAVKIGVFSKGAMTLDHCLKYCLAATCGCQDAPGFDSVDKMKDAIKANRETKGVADTPKSPQYRPAKIEECGKGMMGKKVASGLYIKLEGGPGGMYEVCSKDFLSKLLGPSGDVAGMTKKCKSGASEDVKYGCSWNEQKGKCIVGFSPILTCQVAYTDDPTL